MQGWFDVGQRHPELINACLRLLSPGGVLYFSTNYRGFELREEAIAPCVMEEISGRTVPVDFRNRKIHRCWRAVKDGG
jgi:23S rRNA (cytosine1962-C5)-methyltransferase